MKKITLIVLTLMVALTLIPSPASAQTVTPNTKTKVVVKKHIDKVYIDKNDYYIVKIKKNANNNYYKALKKAVDDVYNTGKGKVSVNKKKSRAVPFKDIAEVKKKNGRYLICIKDGNYKYYEKLAKQYK